MHMGEISYQKILVPTDGSEYSFKAGIHAVFLAKKTGARVYALNVVEVDMAFRSGIHYGEDVCGLEKAARAATGRIKQLCDQEGVPCEEMIAQGKPADAIVIMADKIGADLIVIGSIGMSAIERVLIGSVSDKVMRHAKCPVLLVREQ
ncbi:MAG: Universal stress protein [Methanocella sp. PtaU1.Bin125]|nr:MAG: Universal stress protein [Methanocella sp. PtaU1.Bin125]